MKNLLFPHRFALIGWVMFLVAIIDGILRLLLEPEMSYVWTVFYNDSFIIGLSLGAIFIVCSKERTEDEMIRALRLSSILNALYVFAILIITGTILINGEDYDNFIIMTLLMLPIISVFTYRMEIFRHNKQSENEEQN